MKAISQLEGRGPRLSVSPSSSPFLPPEGGGGGLPSGLLIGDLLVASIVDRLRFRLPSEDGCCPGRDVVVVVVDVLFRCMGPSLAESFGSLGGFGVP